MVEVRFQRVHANAQVPSRGSENAAGYDLHAAENAFIPPFGTATIRTGLKVSFPSHLSLLIFSRSGMGFKKNVRLANCVGVIDADYRGEIMVKLTNDGEQAISILTGDRIAQAVMIPFFELSFVEADLDETDRGEKGFGSTGT